MIDLESFVFSPIAEVLKNTYKGIFVSSEYTDSPARFPAATIIESSNIVLRKTITTNIENASQILFEVNVFSNKFSGAKLEARDIMQTIDAEFERMGFVRTAMSPMPNFADATIYRITARYEGVVVPEYNVEQTIYRIYTS